jgi:hypothetical protein
LGSLLSSRFEIEHLPRTAALFALLIGAMAALSLVVYPPLIDWALPLAMLPRVIVAIIMLFPLGFCMGIPFPSGLRIAHEVDPQAVAAFWGANAVASVLGSAGAMALAILTGFSAALLVGAGLYVLAAVMAFFIWPRLLAA